MSISPKLKYKKISSYKNKRLKISYGDIKEPFPSNEKKKKEC